MGFEVEWPKQKAVHMALGCWQKRTLVCHMTPRTFLVLPEEGSRAMDGQGASNMGGHGQLSLRCRVLPWAQARSLGMGLPTGWWLSQGVQEEKLSGPPPLSLSYHSAVLKTLALLRPFW